MIKEHHIFRAQVANLSAISALGLTKSESEDVVSIAYGLKNSDFLSPVIKPERIAFGSSSFSHVAADIITMNLVNAIALYPQLKGLEENLVALLIGVSSFDVFKRDKDDVISAALKNNKRAFLSMYGHLTAEEFANDGEIKIVTGEPRAALSERLGHQFSGSLIKDFDLISRKEIKKIYVDVNYLNSNWQKAFTTGEFRGPIKSMLDYLITTNDSEKVLLINHTDDRCTSKLCGYN